MNDKHFINKLNPILQKSSTLSGDNRAKPSFFSLSMDNTSGFNASSSSNASSTTFSSISIFWNGRNKVLHDQIHADFAALLLNYTIAIFPTLVILVTISAIIFRLVKSSTQKSSVTLPQPWPLVGNLPELLYNGPGYKWLHSLLQSYATPILCVRLGRVHVIAVNRPDIARAFLTKHDAVFASRPITMATDYCSRGFLSTALAPWGDQWKKMRRARSQEQPKALINIRSAARHYSGNVIRKLIFNRRYFGNGGDNNDGGPGAEEEEHVEALFKALCLLFNMCVSDYMPCLKWLDIGGNEREMRKVIHVIDKHHSPLVEERFRLKRGCKSSEEPQDWLEILISIQDPSNGTPLLTLEEIKAQVVVIINS